MSLGEGGARSLKGGAHGGRDPKGFGPGGEIPRDLAPGGVRSRRGEIPGTPALFANNCIG